MIKVSVVVTRTQSKVVEFVIDNPDPGLTFDKVRQEKEPEAIAIAQANEDNWGDGKYRAYTITTGRYPNERNV